MFVSEADKIQANKELFAQTRGLYSYKGATFIE